MTLTDPVLFVREHILGLGPADPRTRPPEAATDLRLGAAHGSLALLMDDDAEIYRRTRTGGRGVHTHLLAHRARRRDGAARARRGPPHRGPHRRLTSRGDAPAEEHDPAVERDDLAGRDARLRLVAHDAGRPCQRPATGSPWARTCTSHGLVRARGAAVKTASRTISSSRSRSSRSPTVTVRDRRVDVDDELALPHRDAEPAALTDGERVRHP